MLLNSYYTFDCSAMIPHNFQIICSNVSLEHDFKIPLSNGWNLMSLPSDESVDKENISVYYSGANHTWQEAVDDGVIIGFIYDWSESGQNYGFTDMMVPGQGYWIYAYSSCDLWVSVSENDGDHIADFSTDWNLVGIPYDEPLAKDNLTIYYDGTDYNWTEAVDSSIIIGFIYNWNETGQNYEFTDVLNPGDGYWVYAYFECVLFNSDIPSEICDDEIDNDDDDLIDCEDPDCMLDEDNDGYYSIPCGDDCNDTNYDVNPGVVEICDEIDNDCDDLIDEDFTYFLDFDDDGYGNPLISIVDCNEQPEGYVVDNTDCNDTDPDVNPGHPEICDGKDNDCDDVIPSDESDVDGDNWMICEGDCDDNDPQMYPGAEEVCDGKDNDCDSETDEDVVDCDDDNCCTDDYCFDSNCINDPISGIPIMMLTQ